MPDEPLPTALCILTPEGISPRLTAQSGIAILTGVRQAGITRPVARRELPRIV